MSMMTSPGGRAAAGALAWLCGGAVALALDGDPAPGSQALPLVLAAALASLCWPVWAAAAACVLATLLFNWALVSPRGSLAVSLPRDMALLAVMLLVSLVVTLLVARQRHLVRRACQQSLCVQQLHQLSEALRGVTAPAEVCEALRQALLQASACTGVSCLTRDDDRDADADAPDRDEAGGLRLCMLLGTPFGPGTGREDNQPGWYLPMRGLSAVHGAALVRGRPDLLADAEQRLQAQALCDLAGQALERLQAHQAAEQARQAAARHALRSTLLAAISHDCRTPLAVILGAASSLSQQGERLGAAQRQRLADTIVDEAQQLASMTENALQLTRLEAAPETIARQWESLEEIIGATLRRVRGRDPQRRLHARVDPALPLLRCDAVLIVQMLENLIDNAMKHSPPQTPVELLCRRLGPQVLLAVRDRGPGIAPAQRQALLEPFVRGQDARAAGRRGSGLGLALCQAVAQAHGTTLQLRPRGHGGLSVELRLPLEPQPQPAAPHEPMP